MKANNLITKILYTALIAIAMAFATSCSSHRKAQSTGERPARVVAKRTPEAGQLADTYRAWQDVYMPFSMRCSAPMNVNLSGRLTMVAGESVYMSLRLLGLEVGQVWIDTDSVFVAEKVGKTLVAESLDRLTARTGLSLADLQSLLLGQAFYPGTGTLLDSTAAQSLFSVTTRDDGSMLMTPRRTPDGFTWYLSVAAGPVLKAITVEPAGLRPFEASYSDALDTPAGMVCSEMALHGSLASKKLDAMVTWNVAKAEWDRGATASKPSWRGYRRLNARDMLNVIQKTL